MRVAIVTLHHPVGHGRFMYEAFRRIGVDVRSLGPTTGTSIWGMNVKAEYAWKPTGTEQEWWPDWRPDLIVLMHNSLYHHPRYHDVPHIVYAVDNHVCTFRQPGIEHYFLAHGKGEVMPIVGPDTSWLPCAYDPVLCTPSAIPWAQRKYDVALLGVLYEKRTELLNLLAKQSLQIVAGTGAIYKEFRDVYHDSRISLCLSLCGDVAMRVFETAAMRCLVLSDPCFDFPALGAEGIVIFRDAKECAASIRHLLDHPAEADALIEQSAKWVKPHTWDARAHHLCNWFRKAYGTPPSER